MTTAQWNKELRRLQRRIDAIKAFRAGQADLRRVEVPLVWVKRHKRKAHTRLVFVTHKQLKE